MAENRKAIDHLNSLIQLDIDAILAYTQAMEEIDLPEIRNQLAEFRQDHERHVADLAVEVLDLGGTPAKPQRDLKGFFIENFTAVRSKTGTVGALEAMKMNEKLMNFTYERALSYNLPLRTKEIIERNYNDEKRHLGYISQALGTRTFEQKRAS